MYILTYFYADKIKADLLRSKANEGKPKFANKAEATIAKVPVVNDFLRWIAIGVLFLWLEPKL